MVWNVKIKFYLVLHEDRGRPVVSKNWTVQVRFLGVTVYHLDTQCRVTASIDRSSLLISTSCMVVSREDITGTAFAFLAVSRHNMAAP